MTSVPWASSLDAAHQTNANITLSKEAERNETARGAMETSPAAAPRTAHT